MLLTARRALAAGLPLFAANGGSSGGSSKKEDKKAQKDDKKAKKGKGPRRDAG